jgi:hypothetical protein
VNAFPVFAPGSSADDEAIVLPMTGVGRGPRMFLIGTVGLALVAAGIAFVGMRSPDGTHSGPPTATTATTATAPASQPTTATAPIVAAAEPASVPSELPANGVARPSGNPVAPSPVGARGNSNNGGSTGSNGVGSSRGNREATAPSPAPAIGAPVPTVTVPAPAPTVAPVPPPSEPVRAAHVDPTPAHPAETDHYALAQEAMQARHFELAVTEANQAISQRQHAIEARNLVGLAYLRSGQRDRAVSQWRLVLARDPNNSQAQTYLRAAGEDPDRP